MIKYIYIAIAILVGAFVGCSKEEIALYDRDDSALYFSQTNKLDPRAIDDSLVFSFFYEGKGQTEYSISVQINTMGKVADYDRQIVVEQLNVGEAEAAVAGVHYVSFDDGELKKLLVVKAGSNKMNLPVVAKYDSSLDLQTVRLKIGIVENEHFKSAFEDYRSFVVHITAKAEKPANWATTWAGLFGPTWGTVKMKFIIDVTGITNWTEAAGVDLGEFYKRKCADAFNDYNKANPNNPMKEADGTLVKFL